MSDTKVRFHLYFDTIKFATGSALHKIQNGQWRIIAFASKGMQTAAQNNSITKWELYGLAITTFSHLLKRDNFYAEADHLALTHIMKGKAESATYRIKRLLDVLSSYAFKLYCYKGKYIVLMWFPIKDGKRWKLPPCSYSHIIWSYSTLTGHYHTFFQNTIRNILSGNYVPH